MVNLEFKTVEEFERYADSHKEEVSDLIFEGISKAVEQGNKTAKLMDVSLEEEGSAYEITLHKDFWETALTKCLDFYKNTDADKSIETWELLQKIK